MPDMETDRRLRAALRPYQPRLLADVLDTLDIAVVVLDDSAVLAGNVAAARLLGVRRGRRESDAEVANVASITDERGTEVDVTAFDDWRDAAASGATRTLRVERADGTVRWVAASARALAGEDAVVCRFIDVTRRRDLERRAAEAADQAARAVIDLSAAERRVALLEELLVYVATGQSGQAGATG